MKILKTKNDLSSIDRGKSLGFVATMGALHEGHGSLIRKSNEQNQSTAVSVFVNPTQFNNPKDFESYPNVIERDFDFCEKLGVDYVFTPSVDEMYTDSESIELIENEITKKYEGEHRPGHFSGVLTVVLKLINLIKPQRAYFGEKDYQQYLLIKRMAENFFLEAKIVGVETVRDAFGLAQSSRNLNLTPSGKVRAQKIAGLFLNASSKERFVEHIKESSLELELEYYGEDWGRALMAHYVDGVRLIDNKALEVSK